jgi:hypothetical protein
MIFYLVLFSFYIHEPAPKSLFSCHPEEEQNGLFGADPLIK